MKVLFTSPILEHPPAGGPQLRIENSIKALATQCELDIVSRSPASREVREQTAAFLRRYCREFRHAPRLERAAPSNRLLRGVRSRMRRFLDADAREDARLLVEHVDRRDIDVL